MKHRALILAVTTMLILMAGARLILAQQDCGNGLPCGSIPWPQPNPPQLQSPTPMPTIPVTLNPPTQTPGGPTATPAPSATGTASFDYSGVSNQVATLAAVMQTTPGTVNDVNGTPVNTDSTFTQMGLNAGTFFGYARGLSQASFGQMSPLFDFGFLALIVVISIKLITFLLPIGSVIFSILQNVITLIRSIFI